MDILNLLLSVQLILLVASALCFIYFRRRLKKIKQHYDSLNEARKQGIEGKIAIFEQNLNNISAVLNSKLDTYTNTLESELNSYRNLINNAKLELVSNISSYHPVDNFVRCSRVYEKGNPLATSFFKLIERLSCKSVANGEYIRIGRRNDGGYVMLNEFDGKIAAYSFGICDDVSWDSDIASRNIPCYMYDHTIEALPAVGGGALYLTGKRLAYAAVRRLQIAKPLQLLSTQCKRHSPYHGLKA